jgi:hypothetical protein
MPSTATVTSKIGPAITVTAAVLQNVVNVEYDIAARVIRVKQSDPNKITEYDYAATTTVTMTVSAGNWTITISQ